MSYGPVLDGFGRHFPELRCDPESSDQKIAMADREIQSSASHPAAEKGAAEKGAELPNLMGHHKSPHHNKETHGTSDDIDDNTPIDEVKGPSLLHRVKEEIEAVVESVLHPKK